ncbi:elongation of very long chain fatty acids protein 1-like isoform X1 [Argiope bruennichi]|uniref:elongation of very long chain fatty acids protein 1-like isoform X1 n=2 Tax=Argiope bruennichi TaxID=94029 RepID=UPI0024951626|nr:elongation of very long chain fatty acids protein 1-like isoform X1 [Argiope bruennichi]
MHFSPMTFLTHNNKFGQVTMINFTQYYQDFLDSGDPRVASWPMMDNPMKGLTLVVMYLGFVKVVGPAWMRDQKPYNLRGPMIIYNFLLVAISAWIFINMGMLGWFTKYSWRCEPIDYSYNPDAIRMAEIGWYFYITKFIEFADTIFFVLRKKESQISPLHVFHHSLVPITLWFGIKFGPGGYNSIFAFLNSFVHTWMYLYYGLSALGPSFQKYLWWKKYLTLLQMVQFILVFVFMFQLTFFPTCHVSKPLLALNVVQAIIFFVLFLNFYAGSYKSSKRSQKQKVEAASSSNSVSSCYKKEDQADNDYVRRRKSSVHTMKYMDVDYVTEPVTISA